MAWPTFWVEPTGDVEVGLRRYAAHGEASACPTGAYHDATTPIGRRPERRTDNGYLDAIPVEEYVGDDRWPTACGCGYEFTEDDQWQVWQEAVYRRPDTGEEWAQRSLPPGALLDGHWHPQKGPDGIALVCVLPPEAPDTRGHWWHVDGPARSEGYTKPNAWTRTGDPKAVPPTVDVNPSILTPDYHGFLRLGVLSDPV